jgi:hypothetical protein
MGVSNTLAYIDTSTITTIKSFIVQAPGAPQTFPERNNPEHKNPERKNRKRKNPEIV